VERSIEHFYTSQSKIIFFILIIKQVKAYKNK